MIAAQVLAAQHQAASAAAENNAQSQPTGECSSHYTFVWPL